MQYLAANQTYSYLSARQYRKRKDLREYIRVRGYTEKGLRLGRGYRLLAVKKTSRQFHGENRCRIESFLITMPPSYAEQSHRELIYPCGSRARACDRQPVYRPVALVNHRGSLSHPLCSSFFGAPRDSPHFASQCFVCSVFGRSGQPRQPRQHRIASY